MPTSNGSHGKLYVEPPDLHKKLQDVVKILDSIVALNVNLPMKRRMLNHAIWEATYASGNYTSRYRSAEVIAGHIVKLQRDHVFQKKALVDRLLQKPHEAKEVVQSAFSCVVTEAEHNKLTQYSDAHPEVDGWVRYEGAGITVYDMLTKTQLSHDTSAA